MTWNAASFKKHNKSLNTEEAGQASNQANAILEKTGDEGMAIAVANKHAKLHKKRRRMGFKSGMRKQQGVRMAP